MNLHQVVAQLNEKAFSGGFLISSLPELRKKYLHKRKLPRTIFSALTISQGADIYAFHHGGRDEMQFNIGEESKHNQSFTRYGLCFSLEKSRSLLDPVRDLSPIRKKFDQCIDERPELFREFEMWYFKSGKRYGPFSPQKIEDGWFLEGNFICLGSLIEKPISELEDEDLTEILTCFDKLLPIYKFCVLGLKHQSHPLRIFTRLTSNENHWKVPSSHRWRKGDQGKKNIPFENQYGFGHEEWLLNPSYKVGDYQYGYIRGISRSQDEISEYSEVHLYTVRREKNNNRVYYLGLIRNVSVVKNNAQEEKIIRPKIDELKSIMINDIQNINGDTNGLLKFPFEAIVKFRLEDVLFFDDAVFQPNFDLYKYKRFQPYQLTGSVDEIFTEKISVGAPEFVPGKASQTSVFNKRHRESSVTIEKMHSEIVEALENYLHPIYSLTKGNISIEKMRFSGNIADIVTLENDNSISIYEIKTSASGRRSIREAIAQLLDYALHAGDLRIRKLVIVSPSMLSLNECVFFSLLKERVNFKVEYFYYKKESEVQFLAQ